MLNHTYTSVKNANLVDCGKKQHIPSQPSPLLKDNFLGEFRTELDKKKVLANLGIATSLSLEWEYIKGDIGRSDALMQELDSRTKYVSEIDGFQKSIIDGIKHLETVISKEEEGEETQNNRLAELETLTQKTVADLDDLKDYITNTVDVNVEKLQEDLTTITESINNITNLIQVSNKEGNAIKLLGDSDVAEGEIPGLYVPDLSSKVNETSEKVEALETEVSDIKESLDDFVTKEDLGGNGFEFVDQSSFDSFANSTTDQLDGIREELANTVKTGEDGHVDTLYVNKVSKDNDSGNIQITDSFEVTGGIPLDIRFVVKTLEELHALKPSVCYAGMGVIVSSQASLYILREPSDGIINDAYIKDEQGVNWKCPEDLVIEVISQDEYDTRLEAGTINPHMFYYIHEEVVEEPNRKDFESDEAYTEALNRWLRVLQQKYMSAVWGQEIESLVASKASNTAIKSLESEIQRIATLVNKLSGGTDTVNLKDLNDQVVQNRDNLDTLIKEDGTIPTLQKDLSDLQKQVSEDYVTKEDITTDNPDVEYIFLKKSEFDTYQKDHNDAVSKQITTEQVITNSVVLGTHTVTTDDSNLLFNKEAVAFLSQLPLIEALDSASYEAKEDKDDDTYYMVYDTEERYVPDSEFTEYKTSQAQIVRNLSDSVTNNQKFIGELINLTTDNKNTLVFAINELVTKINNLTAEVQTLKEQLNNSEPIG